MQTVFFMHLPLGLSTTGLHSFQMFSPAFLIRWSQKTDLPAGRAVSQPLASVGWEGNTPGYFQVPKWTLQLREARSYAQPWCGLLSLPVLATQEPSTPSIAFSLGAINCACLPLDWHHWSLNSGCYQPYAQMEPEDSLHSRWNSDLAPCLEVGKPGSRAHQSPCLRT